MTERLTSERLHLPQSLREAKVALHLLIAPGHRLLVLSDWRDFVKVRPTPNPVIYWMAKNAQRWNAYLIFSLNQRWPDEILLLTNAHAPVVTSQLVTEVTVCVDWRWTERVLTVSVFQKVGKGGNRAEGRNKMAAMQAICQFPWALMEGDCLFSWTSHGRCGQIIIGGHRLAPAFLSSSL